MRLHGERRLRTRLRPPDRPRPRDAGFTDVRGEGRARVVGSSDPGFDFFRLSFESLRATLVDSGELANEDADAASSRFGDDMRVFTPLMVAGIGRRA